MFSRSVSAMEFRIFHNIFCDMFQLEKKIAFNEYVSNVIEKYILSVIEIRLIDWILLLIMLVVVMTDSTSWTQASIQMFGDCDKSLSSKEFTYCEDLRSAQFFTFLG